MANIDANRSVGRRGGESPSAMDSATESGDCSQDCGVAGAHNGTSWPRAGDSGGKSCSYIEPRSWDSKCGITFGNSTVGEWPKRALPPSGWPPPRSASLCACTLCPRASARSRSAQARAEARAARITIGVASPASAVVAVASLAKARSGSVVGAPAPAAAPGAAPWRRENTPEPRVPGACFRRRVSVHLQRKVATSMPRAKVRRFRSLRKTLDIREAAVKARTTLRSRLRAGLKSMAPFKPRASSDSIITWRLTMVSKDLSTGARCGLNVSGGSARQSAQERRPKRAASLRHSRQNA
mmetsp:Transcript_91476/g.296012  ORF Transcript_91476/g.296012 Transcript_91476/m.296012 type:complete len:297 (-) Transcript_91476:328-1218(-)